ncbi:potassium channel family protein [Isachenkonia alkalipeptolytica]|uniref:Two pore domain potassium channel family protein n=1 Tax=Isachenkonia alkalipeptolytica TaxID=2565777 RepID=A0AA43XMB7_9CLOT|nr:potassium channel family protein [Isachenkonia alkalipeptolytica]NBG89418.1 two pore domain potassium channel family protein [Isachenkonia alkalipeptolytica]
MACTSFENAKALVNSLTQLDGEESIIMEGATYHLVNSYDDLIKLNNKFNFIRSLNRNGKDDDVKHEGSLLENVFFVIRFDIELSSIQKKAGLLLEGLRISNCVFLGELKKDIQSDDDPNWEEGSLVLDRCLIKNEIRFVFNPVSFEAYDCCFMGSVSFHDLRDTFAGYFCDFTQIEIQTAHIDNLVLEECSAKSLLINFDSHQPILNVVEITHCRIEDISFNSNNYAARVINKKLVLIGNDIKNFTTKKLHAKTLWINKCTIENIMVEKSIIDADFIMVENTFDTINLRGTYFRGKILFDISFIEYGDMNRIFKYNLRDTETIENVNVFIRLANQNNDTDAELKLKYFQSVQKNKAYNTGVKYIANKVLDITTGYFTNYRRIVLTMIATIVIFGAVYSLFPQYILVGDTTLDIATNNNTVLVIVNSFYFSLISYTTIGYGDLSPIGIFKLLSGIEGMLGVLISASLVTVFARKFL